MGHLLIGIVGCAVGFAENRQVRLENLSSTRDRALLIGISVVSGVEAGTLLAGCGLLAYRRWRGDTSCPSRAGHWLLIRALAIHAMLLAANYLIISSSRLSPTSRSSR